MYLTGSGLRQCLDIVRLLALRLFPPKQ
jgi:hypothetical protein